MRSLTPLLLATSLLLAMGPVHADDATVLLAWVPPASAAVQPTLYEVYGVAEGTETFLGATEQNVFHAAPGYASYAVKYRNPAGEGVLPCVWVDPSAPAVGVALECD